MKSLYTILNSKYIITLADDRKNHYFSKDNTHIYKAQRLTDDSNIDIFYYEFPDDKIFDYKTISKILNYYSENNDYVEIYVLFKSWDDEMKVKTSLLKDKSSKEKREINLLFKSIFPVYSMTDSLISIEVDNFGRNYLEYNEGLSKNKNISAKIFNVSMKELYKLFNVKGNSLFDLNIRIGIQNKPAGKKLREIFKSYIKQSLYENTINESFSLFNEESIDNDLKLPLENHPSIFWLSHNGVNIFIPQESNLTFQGNKISFSTKNVSVINGAQTLTNFFIAAKEVEEEIVNENLSEYNENQISDLMNLALSTIYVKTIFIYGSSSYTLSITKGLNNQIPVNIDDFVAASEYVEKINNFLKKYQVKINKTGTETAMKYEITPLQFIKLIKIINFEPGKSKNYNKTNLEDEIKEISEKFDDKQANLISILLNTDDWWKNFIKQFEEKDEILRFGKNYFLSFLILHIRNSDEDLDVDSNLEILFSDFKNALQNATKYSKNIDANTFKSDDVFNEIQKLYSSRITEHDTENNSTLKNPFDDSYKNRLIYFLNNQSNNKRKIKYLITEFNSKNNVNVTNLRTLPRVNNHVKESFPLPSSTFKQLVDVSFNKMEIEDNNKYSKVTSCDYPEFEDSVFNKELQKSFTLYLINWNDEENLINSIDILENFSLLKENGSSEQAKNVYDTTIEAFKKGEINLFPKSNKVDNNFFHVRTKALNSQDTFLFTDGTYITKRTFWASKHYMEKCITNYH